MLMEQEIELKTKNEKKKMKEYKILIDIIVSEEEDLKIRVVNKLKEMKKIKKINELEKEKCLACISVTERLYGY